MKKTGAGRTTCVVLTALLLLCSLLAFLLIRPAAIGRVTVSDLSAVALTELDRPGTVRAHSPQCTPADDSGMSADPHNPGQHEDYEEDLMYEVGKLINVNNKDKDNDRIPDYLDGFDLDATNADDNINRNEEFAPLVLTLPKGIDYGKATVRLGSSPCNDPKSPSGGGKIRLWTKKGDVARQKGNFPSGDYLAPGDYTAADLGFQGATNAVTFYVEAVSPSANVGDIRVLFEVRIDERNADFIATDEVRFTAANVDLVIHKPKVIADGEPEIPELDELSKGSVTFANIDNDDEDSTFDNVDDQVKGPHADSDNELVKVILKIEPSDLALGQVKLVKTAGASSFAVRTNDIKSGLYPLETALSLKDDFAVTGGSRVKTMWLEGVSAHTIQQEAKVKMQYSVSSAIIGEDEAALTVVGVEKVKWKAKGNSKDDDDNLTTDTNWTNGLTPAAWRVFPDARIENGAVGAARDTVTVETTLTVAPPYKIKVYLCSFDMDDPTSANGPVDSPGANTNEFESTDCDNRGRPAMGTFVSSGGYINEMIFPANIKTTNCEFRVTLQPGDNFRIVANGDKNFLDRLENDDTVQNVGATDNEKNINKQRICFVHGNKVTGTPKEREIVLPEHYATDVLTVWRFLHVEVDSMGAVSETGTGRFEKGWINIGSKSTEKLLKVSSGTLSTNYDDDDTILPHLPIIGDEVVNKFEQVYIVPVTDGGGNTNYNSEAVAFKLNLEEGDYQAVTTSTNVFQSIANRLPRFLCTYVLSAFQNSATPAGPIYQYNKPRADRDSDLEEDLGGKHINGLGSVIFMQYIGGAIGAENNHVGEQNVIVHEIAHDLGAGDTYVDGPTLGDDIMGDGAWYTGSVFYPEAVNEIRKGTDNPRKRE